MNDINEQLKDLTRMIDEIGAGIALGVILGVATLAILVAGITAFLMWWT